MNTQRGRTWLGSLAYPGYLTRARIDGVTLHLGTQSIAGDPQHSGSTRLIATRTSKDFFDQRWFNFGQQHLVQVFRGGITHVLKISVNGGLYMLPEGDSLF